MGNGPSSPSGGAGGSTTGKAAKCPCKITSKTVATDPKNRARLKIGVGEEVDLTVSPGPATWSITSGTGMLTPGSGTQGTGSLTTVRFTATDKAGSVTIRAQGPRCHCTITFKVVAPSRMTMARVAGHGLKHTYGRADCGWLGQPWIHPNDVNFYRVEIREKDSPASASGSYSSFNGVVHGQYPPPDYASPWFPLTVHTGKGSSANAQDQIYSGYTPAAGAAPPLGTAPPFVPGVFDFAIVWQWRVGTGAAHDLPAIHQHAQVSKKGRCVISKAGHTESRVWKDPTSNW